MYKTWRRCFRCVGNEVYNARILVVKLDLQASSGGILNYLSVRLDYLGPVHTNVVIRFQTKTELVCLSFSYSFRPSTRQRRICFENAFTPSVRMLKWIAQYSKKAHGDDVIRPWRIFFGGPSGCPQKDTYRKLDFLHYPISNAFCRAQWINSRL